MPEIAVFESSRPAEAVAKAKRQLKGCQILSIQTCVQGNLYVLTVLYYSERELKMSRAKSA